MTIELPPQDIAEGASRIVETEAGRILLCRFGGALLAVDEMCPHQKLSLEGARIRKGALICPHHGARFSLDDGRSMSPLTPKPLKFHPVRTLDDDGIAIDIQVG